jgi:exodeoxyribonuclease-5
MLNPDYRLETIHRQALDNPIIWVANQARLGKTLKFGKYGTTVLKTKSDKIGIDTLLNANQIICGKNVTRTNFNNQLRDYHGFTTKYPQENDKMICLKNNSQNGLINGMTGKCVSFNPKKYTMTFLSDEDDLYEDLLVDANIFNGTKSEKYNRMIDQFDYGYCITGHKSQGSQYDRVIVYEERLGFDQDLHNRWLYTTITRAINKLIIIS